MNKSISNSPLEDGYDFHITDKYGEKYHFRILTFPVPSGTYSEAVEVIEENPNNSARIYSHLSGFDADIEQMELELKAKIQKGINQRHIDEVDGHLEINDNDIIRGRIDHDDNLDSAFDTYLSVDGKKVTIEQFVEMLQPNMMLNFRFEVRDRTLGE
ncbi:DUF7713 domain-containing protein [Carboxylicivirga marina]|uniref:Uncharacterized protein n=1 Tax=Carboxylicivirga marina TaxID=2800988 RepID=A0ABS1HLB6_9BACT|nr:hypothetical protein [Carboxylicivirga marina]MBK3518478.1 hypothetical protein [Carboxylicivirga marina]